MEPAVDSTPPSAGVTPAPSGKKSQNGEDAILLSGSFSLGSFRSEAKKSRFLSSLARYFYGRGGRRAQPPVGEGSGLQGTSVRSRRPLFSLCHSERKLL